MLMHHISGRQFRFGIRNMPHTTISCMPYWEEQTNVKSQMGTKNDIKWFGKILQRNPKVEVTEFSEMYPNKGTKKFYRAYVEVKKRNVAEK